MQKNEKQTEKLSSEQQEIVEKGLKEVGAGMFQHDAERVQKVRNRIIRHQWEHQNFQEADNMLMEKIFKDKNFWKPKRYKACG